MIGRILVAAGLTWLALVIILHAAIFVVAVVYRRSGSGWIERVKSADLYRVLVGIVAALMFPVFYPVMVVSRMARFLAAFRMALRLTRIKPIEIDLTVLPKDEQMDIWERMHSDDENQLAVMRDAARRVREAKEATK